MKLYGRSRGPVEPAHDSFSSDVPMQTHSGKQGLGTRIILTTVDDNMVRMKHMINKPIMQNNILLKTLASHII